MGDSDINIIDLIGGEIKYYTSVQKKYLSDLADYFFDKKSVNEILSKENPLIYTVYEMKYEQPGALSYAITVLEPGKVGEEYYFTKGHFHSKSAAEIYLVFQGNGILILQNRAGNTKTFNMFRGSLINVEPDYAHRSINTGNERLVFLAIYPSDSGHEYDYIKEHGFKYRVIDKNGPKLVGNITQN
ncbi:MAG: glucose-6-phosphate isomerase family protein [Thermoplasmata archaeon]